jgi:hypothetical protein
MQKVSYKPLVVIVDCYIGEICKGVKVVQKLKSEMRSLPMNELWIVQFMSI